ncbi:MAG: aldehyde ferredoxin oxidoreductase family protein [Deltaproteobacteria bacterium]|nr:aldehyde ferredoxin oxidoreductase family protein [Deltaproteobacteria bacterium]
MNGFMGKILRVNLSDGAVSDEPLPPEDARMFLGGSGLASKYLFDEVAAGVDPLGPGNKLIYMTGPLTGTISPSSGRFSAVAKSPLSGFWGSANSGGRWGLDLKKSGYDGIIFEGAAPGPVYLVIDDGHAELKDGVQLWGKGVAETTAVLKNELGKPFNVSCIGVAGEKLVRYAAIMNDVHRALGRCGLGAVMGSKNLKAVAVGGNQKIRVADKDAFDEAAKAAANFVNESLLKMTLEVYGTDMVLDLVNVKGGLPTRNWQSGFCSYTDNINGPAINEKILKGRSACFGCPIACGRLSEVSSGRFACKGEGPEYESVGAFGPMCDVSDLEAITFAHLLCNDYGLDTISTGSTIAFAMECFEKGILTKEDMDGEALTFGDADAMTRLVHKIAKREGIGDLLAEGTRKVSAKLGKGSQTFAMQVKGLELPAYDCRATKITGLGFATANRGGDHITAYVQGPTFLDIPFLIVEESTIEDPLVENPAEAKVVKGLEDALTVFDSVGACKFMGMALMAEDVAPVIAGATGWEFEVADFRQAGERIFNLARCFNVREGCTRADDTLPERLLKEPLSDGPAAGLVVDLAPLLDAYYEARGWDKTTGKPSKEKLEELGLGGLTYTLGMDG